jgi:WD40 repeat protein
MTGTPQARTNPYVGPRAFERGDTLYGREREVLKLLNLLIAERIVLLYSPSGAGKTSLIEAGLFPRLRERHFRILPTMRVSLAPAEAIPATANRYVVSLLLSLEEELPPEKQTPLAELATLTLSAYLDRQGSAAEGPERTVLVFDQFEEILTLNPADRPAKIAFFAQVGEALGDRHRWALFAMREEFAAALAPYLDCLPTRLRTTYRLELLSPSAAKEAMQKPALAAGVDFADAAADRLASDLAVVRVQQPDGTTETTPGDYVEPVQLQVVCRRLWDGLAPDDPNIGVDDVENVGDVDTALRGYYADTVRVVAAGTGVSERTIRDWFDRELITKQGIRGQVLQGSERCQGLETVIEQLKDGHLVRAEARRGATWLELAHDRLIAPVQADNAAWREAHLSALQRQAALWEQQERKGALLSGDALDEAEAWARTHPQALGPVENDFLDECRLARTRVEREKRQARRIRWLAVGATAVSIIAVVLAIAAGAALGRADRERAAALIAGTAEATARLGANVARSTAEAASTAAITEAGRADVARSTAEAASTAAITEAGRADRQARLALSGEIASTARNRLQQGYSEQALALALAATKWVTTTQESTNVLRDALNAWRREAVLRGHTKRATTVAASPNGQYVVSTSDDYTARVWQIVGPRHVLVLRGHTAPLTDVAFTPDSSKLVTASRDGTTRVWDVVSGEPLHILPPPGEVISPVVTIDVSRDGSLIATGSEDGCVRLWDLATGNPKRAEPFCAGGAIQDVHFSPVVTPEGPRFVVAASTDTIEWLWDIPTGFSFPFQGYTSAVNSAVLTPDGRYMATRSGDSVKLWEFPPGSLPREVPLKRAQHTAAILDLELSPDGRRLATASQDATIRIWDLDRIAQDPLVLYGHREPVWRVVFSSDGQLLASTSSDGTARLWSTDDGRLQATLFGDGGTVWSPDFTPDGELLITADEAGNISLWRVHATGDVARHRLRSTVGAALAPVGPRVAVAGDRGAIELWSPSITGTQVYSVSDSILSAVAASPDGGRLAAGGTDGQIAIVDAATGRLASSWTGHPNGVRALLFLPGGTHLASAGSDPTIRVWDAGSGRPVAELRGHENDVTALAQGADASELLSASADGTVRRWNWQSGEGQELFEADGALLALAHGSDGRVAAAGINGTVSLWDPGSSQVISLTLPSDTSVHSLAFDPDAAWLAAGGDDGTIYLWDLSQPGRDLSQAEPTTIPAHGGRRVTGLAFTPDGEQLISTGGDGQVRSWPVHIADLVALACSRLDTSALGHEWQKHLPFPPRGDLCPRAAAVSWIESKGLNPPGPAARREPRDPRPTIYYFEAVPGSVAHPGDSVTLRWDVAGATGVYLEHDGQSDPVTSPNEITVTPAIPATYRLVAKNNTGERAISLTISLGDK